MRRGQRTFRPDNKEDRHKCFGLLNGGYVDALPAVTFPISDRHRTLTKLYCPGPLAWWEHEADKRVLCRLLDYINLYSSHRQQHMQT